MSLIKKILFLSLIILFTSLSKSFAEDLKKIGKFKDWEVLVVSQTSGKVCFAQSIPVLIGVVIISFVLTRALPGDPAVYFAGAAADKQSINEIRIAMGLDKTLYEQFFVYNIVYQLSPANGSSIKLEILLP